MSVLGWFNNSTITIPSSHVVLLYILSETLSLRTRSRPTSPPPRARIENSLVHEVDFLGHFGAHRATTDDDCPR
jgi:hypothetical protein